MQCPVRFDRGRFNEEYRHNIRLQIINHHISETMIGPRRAVSVLRRKSKHIALFDEIEAAKDPTPKTSTEPSQP
ncbi:hypothetical protein A0H81_13021 [Grifola frondosa]|uniref:Uncharacterized protein n=1 Tax=Grifola frondosa TaxID=5627 RepID=A0A1C7LQR4_GRIFR|nr:hypothetical protein A0H81_13021 [Grifola frondosa]